MRIKSLAFASALFALGSTSAFADFLVPPTDANLGHPLTDGQYYYYYSFNVAQADTYFSSSVIARLVTCSGTFSACAVTNQPADPTAPDPSNDALTNYALHEEPVFWSGGVLSTDSAYFFGAMNYSYQQQTTETGLNGRGTFIYTFLYLIAPLSNDQIQPLTAWDLDHTAPVASVPEPSTWAMLIVGFAGIACMRFSQRKRMIAA